MDDTTPKKPWSVAENQLRLLRAILTLFLLFVAAACAAVWLTDVGPLPSGATSIVAAGMPMVALVILINWNLKHRHYQ